jgi:galactokinase
MQISNRTLHGSVAKRDIRKFGGGGGCTLVIAPEENVQNVNKIYRGKKIYASLKSFDFASAFVLVFVSAHPR